MRVDRLMALLRSDDGIVGHVVVECLNSRYSLYTSIKGVFFDDLVLMLDGNAFIIEREELCDGYALSGIDSIPRVLRCVLIERESHKIVAYGSNCVGGGYDDMLTCYDTYNSKNSDTYIGVSEDVAPEEIAVSLDREVPKDDDVDADSGEHVESESILLTPKDEVNDGTPFYDAIRAELEDLFERYIHEKALEERIRDSRFVRIYYEDDRYYVVGDIREDGERASLICYGYPSRKGDVPSEVAGDSTEWLPLDREDPDGAGYYMMYQNATTGDIIQN